MTTHLARMLTVVSLVLSSALPAGAVDEVDPGGNPVDSSDSVTSSSQESVSIQQVHTTFEPGDVFVAVGDGKVQWRLPDGTLNMVLDTGEGGFTTGMAFDIQGHRGRFGPTIEVIAPDGRGLVYDSSGNFLFFAEFP